MHIKSISIRYTHESKDLNVQVMHTYSLHSDVRHKLLKRKERTATIRSIIREDAGGWKQSRWRPASFTLISFTWRLILSAMHIKCMVSNTIACEQVCTSCRSCTRINDMVINAIKLHLVKLLTWRLIVCKQFLSQ